MIVSKKSKLRVYHRESCPYAKRIDGKYRRTLTTDQARSRGYHECSWCGGPHGTYLDLKVNAMNFDEKQMGSFRVSWDPKFKAICFRTKIGFWKIIWKEYEHGYKLWHLNNGSFDPKKSDKELMHGSFHRQADFDVTKKIGSIVRYIYDHDRAKKVIEEDYRKLPKNTQKQKRYFKQAKKREHRKQCKRVDELFKKLERGEL